MTIRDLGVSVLQTIFSTEFARDTAFLALVGTVCYLAISGRQIPTELTTIVTATVGFYFGKAITNGPKIQSASK